MTFVDDTPDRADQLPTPPAGPRYRGVGGWLLLLCLGLTVFNPIITFVRLAESYRSPPQSFEQFPGLLVIMVIDTVLSVALMAFSIYAGAQLWRIRPGAVRIAKRYLLCLLGYQAVVVIYPFLAGLPAQANPAMFEEVGKNVFRGALYVAIWYSYLNKSERVRATYAS